MNHGGSGKGPWVMADLEKGLWGANVTRSNEPPLKAEYVTVMLKGGANIFALKGGDAQAQAPLTLFYEGVRPSGANLPGGGHYNLMRKKGAIILGVGGDNSERGRRTFFERRAPWTRERVCLRSDGRSRASEYCVCSSRL